MHYRLCDQNRFEFFESFVRVGRLGPPFHSHVLVVKRLSGAEICAKFLTCPSKKLHCPRKALTSVISLGRAATATAFSLSALGLMPLGVSSILAFFHFGK